MSKVALSLFKANAAIGTLQPDGSVLASPEFVRALSALFARVGGAVSVGTDDLALLAYVGPQPDFEARSAIADLALNAQLEQSAMLTALIGQIADLQAQVGQVETIRAELSEVRKALEGVEIQSTFRDPFRVNWERPGAIGSLTPSTGAFTTISATGQITSTLATGTAPFSIASTTVVPNLNVSQLLGGTWAIPGTIGSTTPNTGAFTTLSATGQITSTLATGTAPFSITSTTVVPNLNVSQLLGATWAAPGTIGSTTPNTGAFTTLTASQAVTLSPANANVVLSPTGTGLVTVNPATAGSMNNVAIGATTPLTGKFTTVQSTGAAGFNGATPQTPVASGGALAAYAAGANGLDTGAHMASLHALVVSIRAALVANGIMS